MKPGEFSKKVCQLALTIPRGRITTYGLLTQAAGGHPMLAQMVTTILWKSPNREIYPYHRIVYSDGRVWLFNDPKKDAKRLKLYKKEGIQLDSKNRIINFDNLVFTFDL